MINGYRMVKIKEASYKDICRIVEIHRKAFPNFFLTGLGDEFLKEYYELVLSYDKSIFLVAERDDCPLGFAAGFLEPPKFYKLLKKYKLRLGLRIISVLIKRPRLISRIFANFRRVNRLSNDCNIERSELASIAVDPAFSGQGIGKLLIKSFLESSKKLGAEFVYLTTDAKNNDAVNYFYLSMGFKLYKTFMAAPDRAMNEYRYYFNK